MCACPSKPQCETVSSRRSDNPTGQAARQKPSALSWVRTGAGSGRLEEWNGASARMAAGIARTLSTSEPQSATPSPQPPSITISWPVMYSEAGDARKRASALMSSGQPTRCMGMSFAIAAC